MIPQILFAAMQLAKNKAQNENEQINQLNNQNPFQVNQIQNPQIPNINNMFGNR